MVEPVFQLSVPAQRTSCAVFNSPHSGRSYLEAFRGPVSLDPVQLRSSEDAYVDELFGSAPDFGAPLLAARIPRACLDLNRAPDDLDPALIAGASRRFLNPRIAAGLGVIPRVVAEGRPIMQGKLTLAEAQRRIGTYWHPYHDQLRTLISEQRRIFGMAILFDCHSMPRDALTCSSTTWAKRPNIILGDRFGAACERWLIDAATDIFSSIGFLVARNVPFAGGYITQTYGRPNFGVHALQIEVDRSLYMNESEITRNSAFDEVRGMIAGAIAQLTILGPGRGQIAAE